MSILLIAYNDLKIRLRDKWFVFLTFFAPMLIIILAAMSFGDFESEDSFSSEIVIINLDSGISQQQIYSVAMRHNIRVDLFSGDKAYADVKNENMLAPSLTIPEGFKHQLNNPVKSRLSLDLKIESVSEEILELMTKFITELVLELNERRGEVKNIHQLNSASENGINKLNVMSAAYFTPSMMIFFLMYSALSGSRNILKEKESGLVSRLLYLPLSPTNLLLGKLLAVYIVALLQVLVLILSSSLILGVSWGQSTLGLFMLATMLAASFTALGIFIVVCTKDSNHASIVGMGCVLLFSCLGGNFVPVEQFPEWIQYVSMISLNRWGLDGILDITYRNLSMYEILTEFIVLAMFTLIFFGLSLKRFKQQMRSSL